MFVLISATPLFQEADAVKAKGTYTSEINSKKVCGDKLCTDVTPDIEIANPSATYCIKQNGDYDLVSGTCTVKSVECDAWDYFKTKVCGVSDDKYPDTQNEVSLLFIQTAHSGTLISYEKQLVLTLNDVSPVTVFFSDRPNRVTGHESTQEFIGKWNDGSDSFAVDPPNAALDIIHNDDSQDILIVELMNPVYDADARTLQYDVIVLEEPGTGISHYGDEMDDSIPESFGQVALFIDSTYKSFYCNCDPTSGDGTCQCSYDYHLGKSVTKEFRGYCSGEANVPQKMHVSGRKHGTSCSISLAVTPWGSETYQTKSCTNWNPTVGDSIDVILTCFDDTGPYPNKAEQ